ncbi:hypothetical protein PGB90_002912 [Kerria lacca]
MTSQPRKFSEKIALHNQKQAEGDEAFRQIMREVTDVTNNSLTRNSKKIVRSNQSCGGGSLPNVNNISSHTNSPTASFVKPVRNNLEDVHISRVDSTTVYRERGRSVGSVGPMRSRPIERRIDTSPYSSGPYLSPPSADLSWRRTNSDSALHQSVQNPNNILHSPGSQRRVIGLNNHQHYDPGRIRQISASSDKRPRSCCEVPSIPDINIFPSQQEPGIIPIPIGNNTGSLPDLTSFQFSSPIHTPLDQDDHHSSTYSSASTQCTSPSTLSPTSLPPRTPGRFSFGSTPPHESSEPPSYTSISPPSPSSSMSSQRTNQYNYQQISSPQGQSPVSPVDIPTSDSIVQTQLRNSMTSYRSPQSTSRPSPQSSPILNIKHYSNNTSPLSSAPPSPISSCNSVSSSLQQPYSSNDYCVTQAQETLPQCFEQIRMDSPVSSSLDYMIPMSNGPSNSYQQSYEANTTLNKVAADQGYYSSSTQQLQYRSSVNNAQQIPSTPATIPDIVITNFSTTNDELVRRDMNKELGCDISNLLSPVEGLRDGLDHIIDIDGFLTQDILNPDSSSQEPFALDH